MRQNITIGYITFFSLSETIFLVTQFNDYKTIKCSVIDSLVCHPERPVLSVVEGE